MKARIVILAMLIAFATPAHAVTVEKVQAPPGVEVWLSEEHSLPVVAVSVSLPAGSAYDPAGKEGLAALTASLLDEGAGDLDSRAFKEALEARAIRFDADTGRDYMVVTLQILSPNVNEAFRLMGLALAHPRFDGDAVDRMRASILAVLKQEEEEPATIAAKAWFKAYFGAHPYAHSDDGTAESIQGITTADIKSFAATHLVRGGAKIAVAGDITEAALAKLVDSTFGPLPSGAPAPIPPFSAVNTPGTRIIAMDVPQPAAVFGMPGLLRSDPQFIPAFVANYILGGGGFSSRLMDEVRDKRGLTYGISTDLTPYRSAGLVTGEVASERTKIADALEVTKAVMARFAREGATAKELADAKTYLTGSFPLGFDSDVKIARTLNSFQRMGLDAGYIARRNALIDAVTLDQVNAAAKQYFDPARLTIIVAGTPQKPQPGTLKANPKPPPQPDIDKPPTP
jgi:zinc protease